MTRPGPEDHGASRADRPPVPASGGRRADFGAAPLVGLPAGRLELAGLGRPRPAVLAGDPVGARLRPLPRRLGWGAWSSGCCRVQWVRLTDPTAWLAWLVMAAHLLVLVAGLPRRWPGSRCSGSRSRLMMAAPILWVGLEYVRAHFLTGFPWYYLGHSQYRFLALIQVADFDQRAGHQLPDRAGQRLVRRPAVAPPASAHGARAPADGPGRRSGSGLSRLLVGGTLVYGAFRLSTARFRAGPRLALLADQPRAALQDGRTSPRRSSSRSRASIQRAVPATPRPDLIVWPETAYPYGYVVDRPGNDPAAVLASQVELISDRDHAWPTGWTRSRRIADHLHGLTDAAGVPMLVGTLYYDHQPDGFSKYNSAILFEPLVADDPDLPQDPPRPVRRVHPVARDPPLADRLHALSQRLRPQPDLRPRADLAAPGPLPPGRRHLLRGHRPARRPPVLPRSRRRPPARHADQPLQRRLVPRLVRARHAPGRERLPDDREPRPPGPRRQHRHLGPDRRQRRDPRDPSPPDRSGPLGDRPARRPHQPLHLWATGWASRAWP